MKLNSELPYPVLSKDNDHYVNSTFDVEVEVKKVFGELVIDANFLLENSGIESLIAEGKACYVLHIECPQTSYRVVKKSFTNRLTINIDENILRNKIDVHPLIVANDRIENYTNSNWNEFYSSLLITYEKGNILASSDAIELILHEDSTETQNLPSIVTIRRVEKLEFMSVDLGMEQIIIELPQKVYNQYAQYGDTRLKETILTLVILPCLVDVFHILKEDTSSFEDYHWYQVLMQIFENNHLSFTKVINEEISVMEAAQRVLRNPLIASFKEIDKLLSEEDEK
ncbi:hypothetical protein CW357_06885 [Rummeliibacillus sp. TYF005]|uniref:hypothetical protein n=1 Tax=Rummeliibacillus sp. TYF005 TaxID=2058214 RepID=UPI000F51E765|nr:hypothetical protein [Rummeliibacillus sp. TYF005]RPJ96070.1 hypothetical protein CW357_06885 [Rummeliibacillus sp. TYF005]